MCSFSDFLKAIWKRTRVPAIWQQPFNPKHAVIGIINSMIDLGLYQIMDRFQVADEFGDEGNNPNAVPLSPAILVSMPYVDLDSGQIESICYEYVGIHNNKGPRGKNIPWRKLAFNHNRDKNTWDIYFYSLGARNFDDPRVQKHIAGESFD